MWNGFMAGYTSLASFLVEYDERYVINEDYKDDWPADSVFLDNSKLVIDKEFNKRNFVMSVPCYLWDLEVNSERDAMTYKEQEISNFVNLFLRDCTVQDYQLMKSREYYLRIFQYQDKPQSDRYCYMYLRKIDDCTFESHKKSLRSVSVDYRACEINYSQRGYFYEFPLVEWNGQCVKHVGSFT